jgi:iron-sulfur cluster assembly accessory protein
LVIGYLCRDLPPKDDIDSTNLRIHTLILTTKSLYGHCSFLAQRSTPYNLIRLMSLPRTTGALSRSASAYIRFAALPPASRQCPQCLRAFSTIPPYRQSSKRQMQTATVFQPLSLHPQPPPPRNAGVPDTSIAGGIPEANNTIPQRSSNDQHTQVSQEQASISIPEGEAQKSQPVPSKPLRPRRYNFGPRKATIKLSASAVAHLRDLINQPEPKYIRIGTTAKGCSGLAYKLEYVDKPSMLDEQVDQDGVKVLIDNKALLNIIGSEMDWLEDKLNQRFIFKNPNISKWSRRTHASWVCANKITAEQCGCGESFSVS